MQDRSLLITATGDLMMNRPLIRPGESACTEATQGVYDLLRQSDIAFVNLEVPLTDRGLPADKLVTFRADPALVTELHKIGTKVVTFANNHALDYGIDGLEQTLQLLEAEGMPQVGTGRKLSEALAPAILPVRGRRVAFVGLCCTLPAGSAARSGRPGVAGIKVFTNYVVDSEALDEQPGTAPYVQTQAEPGDVAAACDAVRAAKEQADIVVVGIHWGVPHGWVATFQDPLATYQRPLAHALIEAGATAIIGNHAHVLHGVEFYQGRPILYCLGNFLFHRLATGTPVSLSRSFPPYSWKSLRSPINRLSAVARLTIDADGAVASVELVPIIINNLGEPELAEAAAAEQILRMMDELSQPLGATVRIAGGRGYAEPEGSQVK